MKQGILSLVFAVFALTVASAASARVDVSIGLNPFGYAAYPPPVVYQPGPYYAPPPAVYFGGGYWGGDRGRRGGYGRGHAGGHGGGGRRH